MATFRVSALALHACLHAELILTIVRPFRTCHSVIELLPHTPIENMPERLERLKAARLKIAQLVLIDRVYLPIFDRLEKEIVTLERDEKLMERARELVRAVQSD
ncbi:hypothetical protein [Sulfitobacter pontiacus]|uniref:hypothetical protein n=1 Tax=Sulfitobacter pontiacus TaxID=60137 RepID=UPI0021A4FCE1|nr:hypothetical protein [Sulfitobacter pontiacus]UWR17589.1 hypothetical protein K3755_07665 [Sulfitobacter pontiacus]